MGRLSLLGEAESFYSGSSACLSVNSGTSEESETDAGVPQGGVLSP